jgi:hypothetical protein
MFKQTKTTKLQLILLQINWPNLLKQNRLSFRIQTIWKFQARKSQKWK